MGEPEQTVNGGDSTIAVLAPAVPVPRNKRVLLVDEDPLRRAMLLNKLRMDGFDVEVASNAVVGLEKLPGGDLSSILLDLTNVESNGVELIKAARRDPQFHKRPIFVSTDAMLGSSLARDAHRAGATKVFNRKATTPESMIAEISAMLASPTETSFLTKSETSASEADLVWLRGNYPLLDRCRDHEARADKCRELWSKVHSVAVAATAGRMHYTARAALALEGFLRELCDRPKRYTHTSLRSIGTAIEALAFLSTNEVSSLEPPTHEFAALIVDQDLFSRTATSNALRLHGFRLSTFEEPSVAIEHMRAHPVNVVLIDLPVAKIDGTDLCKRLCEFALNKNTPVIFVGSEKDLRRSSRALSIKGVDSVVRPYRSKLAWKLLCLFTSRPATSNTSFWRRNPTAPESVIRPFISLELALKALTLVMKNQVPIRPAAPAAPAEPTPVAPAVQQPGSNKQDTSVWLSVKAVRARALESRGDHALDEANRTVAPGVSLNADTGIVEIDKETNIVTASDLALEMFGTREMVGQSIAKYLKGGLENDLGQIVLQREGAERREFSVRVTALKKDGAEFPVSVILTPTLGESRCCWTAVFRVLVPGSESNAEYAMLRLTNQELRTKNQDLRRELETINNEIAMQRDAFAANQKERDELVARICSDELEIKRAKSAAEREIEERRKLEQRLKTLTNTKANLEKQLTHENAKKEEVAKSAEQIRSQLIEAKAAADRAMKALEEEAARSKSFEERLRTLSESLKADQDERSRAFAQEVTELKNVRDQLQAKLTEEQASAAESTWRAEETEKLLGESTAEVEKVKAELEQRAAEQKQLEREWHEKITIAELLTTKLQEAWEEADERNRRFEAEIANLRNMRDDLSGKLTAEQLAAAESKWRLEELERRLGENLVELERVKTELEKAGRNEQAEQRLSALQQVRDELSGELKNEQQVNAESRSRSEQLEARLRQNDAELERLKSEAARNTDEQARLKSELQTQLETAKAAADQAKSALDQKAAQCSQFEAELASLRRIRDELNVKLAAEQRAGAESRRRNEELEAAVQKNATELDRVKADSEKHSQEQARIEKELRGELEAAKMAAEQAQSSLQEQTTKNRAFDERMRSLGNSLRMEHLNAQRTAEGELANLRALRDELQAKLDAEQAASAKATHWAEELEAKLKTNAVELDRTKSELEKRTRERASIESQLREELSKADEAATKANTAKEEESSRNRKLQEEILQLRRAKDEAEARLATELEVSAESKRRIQDLEDELAKSVSANTRARALEAAEANLRAEVSESKRAAEEAEARRVAEAERAHGLEQELSRVRGDLENQLQNERQTAAQSRQKAEELEERLRQQNGELEHLRANADAKASEIRQTTSELQEQLTAANSAVEKTQRALDEKTGEVEQFKVELVNLRQERHELYHKFVLEHQEVVKARKRVNELERRGTEHKRTEETLQKQLETAKAAAEEATSTLKKKSAKLNRLEQERTKVNEVRSDLEARVAAEEGTAKELRKQVEDLEGRLRESASELAKVQSQLESEVSTRTHLESTRQENDSQAVREELAQIREKEAGHAAEIAEMERRVRESVVTLTRLTAELEDERTERRRVEQRSSVQTTQLEQLHADLKTHLEIQQGTQNRLNEIEEQLRTREDELAGVRADFQKELADRKLAEEQLGAVGDMSNQLRDYLGMFQESKQVFQHSQETLEKRLDACLKSISKYESKLSKEGAERKRLEEELAEAQRALREESEKNSTEMAKLKSQLQIEQLERKRLEGEGLQSRVASLDSTRSSRTMVNSLRRQIRKPVESLMQATRRLLDADLDKDQKKLAESLLESAILLQNTVQDSEN